ncbi:FUSC family protein [Paracoccus sp. SSK6]|uniref:FUSC family protein n=1 Tax=Paracoccus sp. SSK6 TaxID=3143131 RepID=UPI00321902AA
MKAPFWIFRALQLGAAASAALTVAVLMGLPSPFWAAMPVWVVAQPFRQDLVLRAVLRVAGTALGAALGWWILIALPDPSARIAALALTGGLGAAAAYSIGTVYSYGVLLAAITVAVIVVPALDHAVDALALAQGRLICTIIGVVAVTAFTFPFTPPRPSDPRPLAAPPVRVVLHRGMIAAATALLGGILLHLMGGPAGLGIALSLCVFSLLIASSRNPAPILNHMPIGAAIGVAAALIYRGMDAALPDPAGMALLLALPSIAAGALLRSHPRAAPFGLDANMCFCLRQRPGPPGRASRPMSLAAWR